MEVRSNKITLLFARLLFLLFAFLFLGVYNYEFLYKTQNVSYFVFSSALFEEVMDQSGGLLIYVSDFLTQFLYYPILGAAILALLLFGLELLIAKLTKSVVISFASVGLVLLAQTSVGYAIYDNFRSSFVFSLLLGCYSAVCFSMAYQKFSSRKYAAYLILFLAAIAYFFIGIYACVAILFISISTLIKKEEQMQIKFLVGVGLCFVLPFVASSIYHEDFSSTIFAPVPVPYFLNLFVLSMITMLLLALNPLFAEKIQSFENRFPQKWAPYVPLLWLLALILLAYRDCEYNTELKMQRLAESHQWDELLKVADEVEHPTSTIFAYRAIALSCKGTLSKNLFKYPCDFKHVKTNYVSEQPRYFEDIFLYASFINNSYLWSMEFWCTTGYSFEHLKKMTICSLLNGEPTLANKYIQVMKQSLFQRNWAQEYEEYVGNLDKMLAKYPELAEVKANLPKQKAICTLDPIRKVYSNFSYLSNKNAERRLLADLYNRNMKAFLKDIHQSRVIYSKTDAPDCIKEALIFCAMRQKNPSLLKGFNVNQKMLNEVQSFFMKLQQYSNAGEAKETGAFDKYKGRYCYYYVFANN